MALGKLLLLVILASVASVSPVVAEGPVTGGGDPGEPPFPGLSDNELIVFGPDDARYTVTVFTDVNCPYSRQLHQEIDNYLLYDIRIRYAAFPNIDDARERMRAVWCSENRQDALTRAKRGETVKAGPCPDPVDRHHALALELGLNATPAIITAGGRIYYGFVSADRLAERLEEEAWLY